MLDIFLYVLGFIITLGFVFWSVSIYYSKDGVVIFDKNHPMFWYRYIMTTPVSISDVLVSRLLCTDVYREYSLNLNDNYFDRQPVNLVNAFKIIHILTLQSIRESRSLCGNFWHDILFLMVITPLVITLSILSLPLHIFFYIIKYTFIGISLLLFTIFVPIKDLIINSISSSNKYLRTNLKKFKEINKDSPSIALNVDNPTYSELILKYGEIAKLLMTFIIDRRWIILTFFDKPKYQQYYYIRQTLLELKGKILNTNKRVMYLYNINLGQKELLILKDCVDDMLNILNRIYKKDHLNHRIISIKKLRQKRRFDIIKKVYRGYLCPVFEYREKKLQNYE